MTKWTVLVATLAALASPGMARAASPDGNHTFAGTIEIKKNLPAWVSCTLTAVINVNAGVPRLNSAVITGSAICPAISFTGLPSTPLDTTSLPLVVVPNVGMNFFGLCFGDLKFIWGGTVNPRTVTFQDPRSDLPGTPPCKIRGTLTQSPGSLNLP
ncbi:hypothetical protein [Sphingopyxis sp. R3-92]|uniref:hypothetical protein n=1 Tax=Sphingopyxis sp. R3-92 TaxID=3158553 RepID=UPI003EE6E887